MDKMSSIELAIQNERTERQFYLNEAGRSQNPVAKRLFETLAEDEEEHERRLTGLHEKLTSDGSWPEHVPIELADTNVKSVLDGIARKQETVAHDDDDIAALNKAIEFEQKGSKLYADLAEECDNPAEKKFFSFLAGIEREHMLSIKDSLFYLEDPQGWLEDKERQGLDGA
ncbi:MAG: ferritin family protein [Polyangia bacterium]